MLRLLFIYIAWELEERPWPSALEQQDDNQSNLHVYVDRCKHYVQAEDGVGNSVLVCAEHQSPRAGAILTLCLCKEGGKGEESCGVAERGGGIWCGIPRQVPQPILNREHVYFYLALEMNWYGNLGNTWKKHQNLSLHLIPWFISFNELYWDLLNSCDWSYTSHFSRCFRKTALLLRGKGWLDKHLIA